LPSEVDPADFRADIRRQLFDLDRLMGHPDFSRFRIVIASAAKQSRALWAQQPEIASSLRSSQ